MDGHSLPRITVNSIRNTVFAPAAAWMQAVRAQVLPQHSQLGSRQLCITIILIAAATLRLNHITQPYNDAFSWRQASTAMIAHNFYHTNWNILYPEVNWTGPGPNYQGREFQTVSYLAALLYVFVGQNDWVGRGVGVMFGLWGIFALYQLIRRVWDEERALAGAAVMALLPGSIFIERSFLPDPAMVALAATSIWMLVAYLQTERVHYLLLAATIGAWGILTKIPGLIAGLPAVYAALTILGHKRQLRLSKLTTLALAAILTLAPVIAYYLWARHLALSYPPYHFAGSGNWLWNAKLEKWWSQDYFLPKLGQLVSDWLWTLPGLALAIFGSLLPAPASEHHRETDKAPWLFHWWIAAGIVYYFIGALELVKNPWNLHIITPPVAALAGHGVVSISTPRGRSVWSPSSWVTIIGILLIIAGFGQSGLRWAYKPYADEGYKLGLALRQITQPGELVVTTAKAVGDPVAILYSQRRGWVFPPYQPDRQWKNQLPEDDDEAIRLFEELRAQGADWLGIVDERKNDYWKDHPKLTEHITRTCEFHSRTPDYVIYRILTPGEIATLSAQWSQPSEWRAAR
jgi:4-amino-4-deoxy-L-arabinose transferase-like glycosyltransferase